MRGSIFIILLDPLHFAAEQAGKDALVAVVRGVQRVRAQENRDRSASINCAKGI